MTAPAETGQAAGKAPRQATGRSSRARSRRRPPRGLSGFLPPAHSGNGRCRTRRKSESMGSCCNAFRVSAARRRSGSALRRGRTVGRVRASRCCQYQKRSKTARRYCEWSARRYRVTLGAGKSPRRTLPEILQRRRAVRLAAVPPLARFGLPDTVAPSATPFSELTRGGTLRAPENRRIPGSMIITARVRCA